MKTLKYFACALVAAGLGACSSDDVVPSQGNWDAQGNGYISVNINLPQERSSRAVSFEDGLASEYEVVDAKLLLYKGTSEETAVFESSYDLPVTGFENVGDDPNQITAAGSVVQKIARPALETGEKLFALVVLNSNGMLLPNTDVQREAVNTSAKKLTATGFMMMNAPLFTKQGSAQNPTGGEVKTLAEIDMDKIKTTAAEAANSVAANIYVERVVGKVDVQGAKDVLLPEGHNPLIKKAELKGWILDNTNNETFLLRTSATNDGWWSFINRASKMYRFVGGVPVAPGEELYRTYWAIDPNYDEYTVGDFQTRQCEQLEDSELTALGAHDYCLENTFALSNMLWNQMTSVVVSAALDLDESTPGYEDFYVLNNNKTTYFSLEGVKKEVKRQFINSFLPGEAELNADILDVTLGEVDGHEGYKSVAAITVTNGDKELQARADEFVPTINKQLVIAYYKGGVSYYRVAVKHFGDEEAFWDMPQGEASYGDCSEPYQNMWLGRYGVLRNNWYSVSVNSLSNIGDPEVPELKPDPADPTDSYIAVKINVLSWAKRMQSADL